MCLIHLFKINILIHSQLVYFINTVGFIDPHTLNSFYILLYIFILLFIHFIISIFSDSAVLADGQISTGQKTFALQRLFAFLLFPVRVRESVLSCASTSQLPRKILSTIAYTME